MNLTLAELQAFKNDMTVTRGNVFFLDRTLAQLWLDGADGLLKVFYEQIAVPTVLLWRADVRTQDLIDSLVGTEYTAGTAQADVARRNLLDLITRSELIDATKAQVRANFAQAAGAVTQAAWTIISQRPATYFESVFAGAPVDGASVSTRYGYAVQIDDVTATRAV